jgi:hypothetical protein
MESKDVFTSSKQLEDISRVYMEAVYGQSAGQELAKREKDDDAFGAPKATAASGTGKYYKEGQPTDKQKAERAKREKIKQLTNQGKHKEASALHNEELVVEKQKDTPDQVKAVIAFDKARKGTEDAVYDTEHGDKKQAKKEKDYAKWQRDKGAEDAQKSGHPWEHAKGSTREKEGKKSEKHAHIKDSYDNQIHSTAIQGYGDAYAAIYENWSGNEQNELATKEIKALQKAAKTGKGKDVAKADKIADEFVPSENVSKLVGSGKFTKEEIWDIYEADSLSKQVSRWEANRQKRMKASGSYERPNWIPRDQDHSDRYGSSKGEKKTTKEGYQRNPEKGEAEERKAEKKRKASGAMPPRGDKRREDFERWYAANVR